MNRQPVTIRDWCYSLESSLTSHPCSNDLLGPVHYIMIFISQISFSNNSSTTVTMFNCSYLVLSHRCYTRYMIFSWIRSPMFMFIFFVQFKYERIYPRDTATNLSD